MIEQIIVGVLVVVATGWVVRSLIAGLRGKSGCSCSGCAQRGQCAKEQTASCETPPPGTSEGRDP